MEKLTNRQLSARQHHTAGMLGMHAQLMADLSYISRSLAESLTPDDCAALSAAIDNVAGPLHALEDVLEKIKARGDV